MPALNLAFQFAHLPIQFLEDWVCEQHQEKLVA
jgi:uncharacterized ferritin-like protein (DUF455 family)